MTDVALIALLSSLALDGAPPEVLLEVASRMEPADRERAFFRFIEEQDRRVAMEALRAWRAAGGRWLHS